MPRRLEGTKIAAGATLMDIDEIDQKLQWGYRLMNVGSALNCRVAVVKNHLQRLREKPR